MRLSSKLASRAWMSRRVQAGWGRGDTSSELITVSIRAVLLDLLQTCSTHQDFYEAEGIKTEDVSVPKKEVAKLMKVYLWALSADDGTNDQAEVWPDIDRITRDIYARRAAS